MAAAPPTDHLVFKGELKGHNGWVTSIATTLQAPDLLLSASRDRSIIVWNLTREEDKYGTAQKRLVGSADARATQAASLPHPAAAPC